MKDTPTAHKLLSIICSRLNIQRARIKTDTTLEELGFSDIKSITDAFKIPTERGLLNLHGSDGKYIKDTFTNHLKRIKTVWNILQFIEANDDCDGKPSAYNLQ